MHPKSARKAYSAEQLMALRRSASDEPAMEMQKKGTESDWSTIRDHVVRGSRIPQPRSASTAVQHRPFDRLAFEATTPVSAPPPVLGEIDLNNQRLRPPAPFKGSPSSSIKKRRAEEILKQHGSPPGVRVTAGGRIVPSEQSPLCSPRYGYSAITKNGGLIKFAPGYPPQPKTFPNFAKGMPNGFVAYDPEGCLCQVVDGRWLQIQHVNGLPQLYITAPNVTNLAWSQYHNANDRAQDAPKPASKTESVRSSSDPSVTTQIAALEKQYQKLESERRGLDKTEVLNRSELTGKSYNQLIQKRRELVERQDEVRRSIKVLQESQSTSLAGAGRSPTNRSTPELQMPLFGMPQAMQPSGWPFDLNVSSGRAGPMSTLVPDQNMLLPYMLANGMIPQMPPYTPLPQAGTEFAQIGALPTLSFGTDVAPPTMSSSSPHGDGFSHSPSFLRSALNPMSPIYEPPGSKVATPERNVVIPIFEDATSTDVPRDDKTVAPKRSDTQTSEESALHSSQSSYATADFFPNNPRDHSLRKDAYPVPKQDAHSNQPESVDARAPAQEEAIAQPELERHNVNWNPTIPDNAFQSRANASVSSESIVAAERSTSTSSSSTRTVEQDHYQVGFEAGLRRSPVGQRTNKSFLDGYCKGLLASADDHSLSSPEDQENLKPVVRLPSVSLEEVRQPLQDLHVDAQTSSKSASRAGSDLADDLKQAATSSIKESVVLPPDSVQPRISHAHGRAFAAVSDGAGRLSIDAVIPTNENVPKRNAVKGASGAGKISISDFARVDSAPGGQIAAEGLNARTFSARTMPGNDITGAFFQRALPGSRVTSSPALDWRAGTSVARFAGTAAGSFAQYDGTSGKSSQMLHTKIDRAQPAAPKFKEETIAELPPSPSKTPGVSPSKRISPAKAKFAAIAGKAGIKVRTDRPGSKETTDLEPMSPQERRGWRDIWKKRNTFGVE